MSLLASILIMSSLASARLGDVRAILPSEQPSAYTPVANHPAGADEMQTGQVQFSERLPWAVPRLGYKTGMIATRVNDPEFMKLKSLDDRVAYFKAHDLRSVLAISDLGKRQAAIDQLSPAEKYDLAVGDLDEHFSKAIWGEVEKQYAHGPVPGWLGLCDGSSSASVLFQQPKRAVHVKSHLPGVDVTFEVGDIKVLLAFEMTTYVAHNLPIFGPRCTNKDDCPGINPASLHEILLEMSEKPTEFPHMIIDRTPKDSIWNAALLSAAFSYFNPDTNTSVSTRAVDNMVDAQGYEAPEGSPGWAKGTRFLLYTATTLRLADTRTVVDYNASGGMQAMDLDLRYVLELDAKLKVIGGEWLEPSHPAFIWALPRDYKPRAEGDDETKLFTWAGFDIPDSAMPAVVQSSTDLQPLYRLLDFVYQQAL